MSLFLQNFDNLLSLDYWFSLRPDSLFGGVLKFLYVFFGLLLLAGLVMRALSKKNASNVPLKKSFEKFYYLASTMAVCGLLFVFFRQMQVYFLGAPFWFLIWFVVLLVWLFFVLKYILVKAPKLKKQIALKNELKKYLP